MELPKLPEGYFWDTTDTTCIRVPATKIQKEAGRPGEQVSFFYRPNTAFNLTDRYKCASCPVGRFDARHFHWAFVDTEQEAISLIVSFALLGITKE